MAEELLPELTQAPGATACHLLIADEAASAVETEEKKARAEKNLVPRRVVLVESWDHAASFQVLCGALAVDGTFSDATTPPKENVYRLQNSRSPLPESATGTVTTSGRSLSVASGAGGPAC